MLDPAGCVVTSLGKVSVLFVTSQWVDFNNCVAAREVKNGFISG